MARLMESSPEHLRACLIRTILGWGDRKRILDFIDLWRTKHGHASAEQLRAELNAAKEKSKVQTPGLDQVRR